MLVHQLAMTFQESWTEPVQEPDLWYQNLWPFVRVEMFVSPYHLIHSRTNWFFSLVSPLQQCLITYRAIFS